MAKHPPQQRELTQYLVNTMLWSLRDQPDSPLERMVKLHDAKGNEESVHLDMALRRLAAQIWPDRKANKQETSPIDPVARANLERLTKDLAADPETYGIVVNVMAHAGHLHQMAGLMAREWLLAKADKAKDDKQVNPVRRMLLKQMHLPAVETNLNFSSVDDAIEKISKPVFEVVLTGHPTHTNSVDSMQKQRILAKRLMRVDPNKLGDAKVLLHDYASSSILPGMEKPGGHPTALSVHQEVEHALYFMKNIYRDLPLTYEEFDRELNGAYKAKYKAEKLQLGIKLDSWASGDKDGNARVNGDTTLDALVQHQLAITTLYTEDMTKLGMPDAAEMGIAAAKLQTLQQRIQKAMQQEGRVDPKHKPYGYLLENELEQGMQELKQATANLNLPRTIKNLETQYQTEKKPEQLNLLRRMRSFGLHFGHLEYRETAEEYERVVATLLPTEYGGVYKEALAARNELEEQSAHLHTLEDKDQQAAQEKLIAETEAKVKEVEGRREAVLSDLLKNPSIIQNAIAANKDKLEAQASKPYSEDDAWPIVYHTLKRMELAREFPDMIQNNVLAECKGTSNMLEALLLQHAVAKDGKRATLGVVPLFEEHATLKTAPSVVEGAMRNVAYAAHLKELSGVRSGQVQQIQLAHSDNAKRAGVPASRALLRRTHDELREMFDRFNHGKAEADKVGIQFFEGGSQSDPYRGGVRSISATVNEFGLHDFTKMTYQGGDLLNYFNIPVSTRRLFSHNIANAIVNAGTYKPMDETEKLIVSAFDDVKESYLTLFNDPKYADFLRRIGYSETAKYTNLSSRAADRGTAPKPLESINGTRAIGISKTLQHAGLLPTWLGMKKIYSAINERLGSLKDFVVGEGEDKKDLFSPKVAKDFYAHSATFRDIIDRELYGLMRTDLDYTAKVSMKDGKEHELVNKFAEEYANPAYKLCMEAYTGMPASHFKAAMTVENARNGTLREIIKEQVFPHMKDMINDQERYLQFERQMRAEVPRILENVPKEQRIDKEAELRMTLHNMEDTVHHGRQVMIDDPTTQRAHCQEYGITLPWVNNSRKIG